MISPLIDGSSIQKSTKSMGVFERPLISAVVKHFKNLGYVAIPHARFNVAWSSILSDLDVLLLKENEVTLIEVKSSRDKFSKAFRQISNVAGIVDYAYIATNKKPRKWKASNIGLLFIERKEVHHIFEAKKFEDRPNIETLFSFKKKCLSRLTGRQENNSTLKYDIVSELSSFSDKPTLRNYAKEIALCSQECETNCPIWNFPIIARQSF